MNGNKRAKDCTDSPGMGGDFFEMTHRIAVYILAGLLLFGEAAFGERFQIMPSVSVRQEYNTNIFFTSEDVREDFITTVIPAVDVSDSTERMTLNLFGRLKPRFYWKNSDQNDVDHDYRGKIRYKTSPLTEVGANAGFRVDNRPDRDLETTGLITRGTRYSTHAGFDAAHAFSEISSASFSYSFDHDEYRGEGSEEDFTGHSLNLGAARSLDQWAPRVTGRLNLGFGSYDYETSKTTSFFASAGASYRLSETLNLQASLGGRYAEAVFDTIVFSPVEGFQIVEKTNTGWGGIGSLQLGYTGLRTRAGILVSHDLRTAGSRTGPSALTRVVGSINYRFLEKLTAGISAGFFNNRADAGDFSIIETNENAYDIGPRFRWELFRHVVLDGAYTYRYNNDEAIDRDRDQQLVYITITAGYPLSELFADLADIPSAGGFPWPR